MESLLYVVDEQLHKNRICFWASNELIHSQGTIFIFIATDKILLDFPITQIEVTDIGKSLYASHDVAYFVYRDLPVSINVINAERPTQFVLQWTPGCHRERTDKFAEI